MGYGSVLLVISAIIVSGVLLLSMESATDDADEELNEYHYKELARNAATTGLELTVFRLAESNNPGSWDGTFASQEAYSTTPHGQAGTFRTEITPVPAGSLPPDVAFGDMVDVTARGFNGFTRDPQTGNTVPISQVIHARYIREYADGGIPPSFRNVITTNLYIQLTGNVGIYAINNQLNANIHTNGDLITNGNSFLVEGYGSYTGNSFTNQANNFVPNVDYNGSASNVFWADSVTIPTIDIAGLQAMAATSGAVLQNEVNPGNPFSVDGTALSGGANCVSSSGCVDFTSPGSWPFTDLNGNSTYRCTPNAALGPCGTPTRPFILFVKGAATFVNRIEFNGYGIVVSQDNIYISPNGNGGGVFGDLVNDETTLMLATTQDINIGQAGGNTCLGLGPPGGNQHCQSTNGNYTHGMTLYAGGRIEFVGTPYIIGGLVTPEAEFTGNGTPTITYAAPTEEITDPGFEFQIPIGPVLVAYSEW